MSQELTQEYLKSILDYNPKTGVFIWINSSRNGFNGRIAGSLRPDGYYKIKIFNKNYLCHRLAYLHHHGHIPEFIDHIDLDRGNNSISNLRPAERSNNSMNTLIHSSNTSGVKGVSWNKKLNKWASYISCAGVRYHLGVFENITDAEIAIKNKRILLHKEFANHG